MGRQRALRQQTGKCQVDCPQIAAQGRQLRQAIPDRLPIQIGLGGDHARQALGVDDPHRREDLYTQSGPVTITMLQVGCVGYCAVLHELRKAQRVGRIDIDSERIDCAGNYGAGPAHQQR
jgi:hypothetical protein